MDGFIDSYLCICRDKYHSYINNNHILSDHETVRIWLVGARVHDLELGRITGCIGTNDGTDGIVYLFDTRTNTSASTFPYGWDCNFNIDNKCDYNRLASKKLGLAKIPSSKLLLDYSVKEQLYEGSEKYLKDLKQKEALEATDWSIVEQFLPQKEIYPKMPVRTKDVMADIRLRILDRERSLYWSLYTNGVISSGTQRRLNAAIDEQYDRDGKKPLCDRGDIFEFCEEPSWIISMKFFSRFFQKWVDIYYQDRIILGYDLARGLIIAQKESLKLVNEFGSSETVSTEYESCLSLLQVEIRKNITRASNFITKISIDYPKSYKEAVTRKSVRMLLSNEKKRIEQFKEQGLISQEEAEQMVNELGERHNKVFTSYQFLK